MQYSSPLADRSPDRARLVIQGEARDTGHRPRLLYTNPDPKSNLDRSPDRVTIGPRFWTRLGDRLRELQTHLSTG